MTLGELIVELGIDVPPDAFEKIQGFINKAGKKSDSLFRKLTKKVNTGLGRVVTRGLQAGFTGIAGAVAYGAKNSLEFEEQLTDLDIASKGVMGSMDEVRRRTLDVSKAHGVAKEQVLESAASFVALTGDGKTAAEAMDTFAKTSMATGASMEDVSSVGASMARNMGIAGKDFEKGFSILVRGGKEGAVEFQDMARNMAELAPLINEFKGGSGISGLAELGAGFQEVMKGSGSADKAKVRFARFMEALSSPRTLKFLKSAKGGRIKLFEKLPDGRKVKRNLLDVIDDLADSPIARDPELLNKAFESAEARAAARQLLAVKGAVRGVAEETKRADDVNVDSNRRRQSAAFKAKQAMNDLKLAITEAFSPQRVKDFADALSKVLGFTAKLVDKLSQVVRNYQRLRQDKLTNDDNVNEAIRRGYTIPEAHDLADEAETSGSDLDTVIRRRSRESLQNVLGADSFGMDGARLANSLVGGEALRPQELANLSKTINAPLTLNIQAGSTADMLQQIKTEISNHWDRKVREAAVAP